MPISANDRRKIIDKGFVVLRVEERSRALKVGGGLFNVSDLLKESNIYIIQRSTSNQFSWHDYSVVESKAKLKKQLDELLKRPDTILDE